MEGALAESPTPSCGEGEYSGSSSDWRPQLLSRWAEASNFGADSDQGHLGEESETSGSGSGWAPTRRIRMIRVEDQDLVDQEEEEGFGDDEWEDE